MGKFIKIEEEMMYCDVEYIPNTWNLTLVKNHAKINETSINKKTFKYDTINYIEISAVHKGKISKVKKIPLKESPSRAKRLVKSNDILISTVRPNLQHYTYIEKASKNTIASTGFAIISSKTIDSRYLYYCLTTPKYIRYLTQIADSHTSAYPSFTPDIIEETVIIKPNPREDEKIGNFLRTIDKKIKVNQQINKTLEEIGKTIFKQWFVNFEFPDKEGKLFKTDGGKLIFNKELNIEFPEGWSGFYLKDYLIFEKGIEPGSRNYQDNKNSKNIRFIRVGDLSSTLRSKKYIKRSLANNNFCAEKDILISLDATLGIVRFGLKGSYSSGIRKVYNKRRNLFSQMFIYFLLKTKSIQNTIKKYANGTTILHAGKAIKYMKFVLPLEKYLRSFDNLTQPLFLQILNNLKENQILSRIRDSIIPILLTGRIRILNTM